MSDSGLSAGLNIIGLGGVAVSRNVAAGGLYVGPAWWLSTISGIAIFITVLGFNLFGDWLKDTLDPSMSKTI